MDSSRPANMPEAIATTKRKFYKALDTLTNPPARPVNEPAAKRVRRSISGTSSMLSHEARVTNSTPKDTAPKQIPNFAPWSQDTFLARIKSFSSVSMWHPKPEAISEVEWAKRGWTCVDVNTVACKGGCEARLVVSLNRPKADGVDEKEYDEEEDDENSLENMLVERYKQLIVDGHKDTCLWRKAGCKDDIYQLQVIRSSVWLPGLKRRYQSVYDIAGSIRDVRLKSIPRDTATSVTPERLLADLPSGALGSLNSDDHTSTDSTKSLEIALHGWRGSSDSGNNLLHCDACFQRIGLWMYQPNYKPTRRTADDHEDGEDLPTIDLVEMHREHCPWRNPETQKASSTLAGLNASQILQRIVSTYAREQRRRSDQQKRAADHPDGEEDEEKEAPSASPTTSLTREEIAKQDAERESRLRKLKRLFTIKRKSAPVPPKTVGKFTK
jgi:hypothetical protein